MFLVLLYQIKHSITFLSQTLSLLYIFIRFMFYEKPRILSYNIVLQLLTSKSICTFTTAIRGESCTMPLRGMNFVQQIVVNISIFCVAYSCVAVSYFGVLFTYSALKLEVLTPFTPTQCLILLPVHEKTPKSYKEAT